MDTCVNPFPKMNDKEGDAAMDYGVFIVARQMKNGAFRHGNNPFSYIVREKAEREAQRLAKQVPGACFTVFKMVTKVVQPAVTFPPIEIKRIA